jgi:pimeloyl-[acyl-carrier protein] methyl ester esterase
MTTTTSTVAKPDLVLLHGWGLGSNAWQPALPALRQRFTVHPFSLPGYRRPESRIDERSSDEQGQSPHEQTISGHMPCRSPFDAPRRKSTEGSAEHPWGAASSPTSNEVLGFEQTAELLAEALPEGSILCGWSLGSLLAMQTAALAPQRFKRLILVGSTPRFTQLGDWPHAQATTLLDLFSEAVARNAIDVLQRFIALLNQGDVKARAISRSMRRQLLADPLPDTAVLLAGLDWLRDVDLRAQLARISTPTLLIHGENDPLMLLPAAQWLAQKLPDARLEIVPGAAHAPFLNDPEGFARRLGDFCDAPALN